MITFFSADPNVSRSISAYNQGLTQADLARVQESIAANQAEQQARAQQAALQSQAQQNQQMNALRQQELNQQSAYQQGQLSNQRAMTDAQLAWQKALAASQAGEADKDRANRLKIAEVGAGAKAALSPQEIEAMNGETQAMAGRLNFALKGLKDAQAAEEAKAKSDYEKNINGWNLTFDSTHKKNYDDKLLDIGTRYRSDMQRLIQSVPKDSLLDFDQNSMQFVPRTIGGKPTASTGGFFNQGQAGKPTPDMVLQEAADAIAKGANPQAVQERLQSQFGVSLPTLTQPPVPTSVWPPVAVQPAPATATARVMPIPGTVAPMPSPLARGYFGQSFPAQFAQ